MLCSSIGVGSTIFRDSLARNEDPRPVLLNNFNRKAIDTSFSINKLSILEEFKSTHTPLIMEEKVEELIAEQDTSAFARYINDLNDKILETGNTVDKLTEEALASLPVGIVKTIGNLQYVIAVDSVQYTANGNATLSAYMSLEVPGTSKKIAFAGKGIEFHPGGILVGNSTKLMLVSNHKVPLGQKVAMVLDAAAQNNYIEWDCDGFKSINLGGRFEFSREVILPENGSSTDKVSAEFEVNMTDWRNMLVGVSIPKFKLKKLKDIGIEVDEAWMDFSDIRNPEGMKFPDEYNTANENTELWEGFYMKGLTVFLPKSLIGENGVEKEIRIEHAIIDNMGFSGSVMVEKLLSKENGNMENWPLSIEHLEIRLVKNRLKSAKMSGALMLPLFKDDSLAYSAFMQDKNGETDYAFTLRPIGKFKAEVFKADISLESNSIVTIIKEGDKFVPSAVLNGSLTINGPIGNSGNLKLNKITFQNLRLSSKPPVFQIGAIGLGSGEQKLLKFPIYISAINVVTTDTEIEIGATVSVNFMKASDKGFSGSTTLKVLGEIKNAPTGEDNYTYSRPKWEFNKVKVLAIDVNVVGDVYTIKGKVNFFEKDEVYGNGFRGELDASFKGINVEAIAQFGTINGTRYWYVDALVATSELPLVPLGGAFGIYGFRGGLYYHMTRKDESTNTPEGAPTYSGIVYVPDANTGIGFKAGVVVATAQTSTFNGDATFEMNFYSTGGVKYIGFLGEAYFLTPMENRSQNAPMYASLLAEYDMEASSFHGSLQVYINYANSIRGVGNGGLAGNAVIHFEPSEWYIHVGRPDQKVGLEFFGLVTAQAYFMLGDNIPPFPDLPEYMTEFTGSLNTNLMRNENMISSGRGIAFGASLEVDTGKKNFLIFYGRFNAALGFDIMLKDYGDVRCAGRSGPIGMDGWYASGQAWALLQGSVGVNVNLKFVRGEFDIASFNAGAVLLAKLPNPTYVTGMLFGNFNILGGLVKGGFSYQVSIGEECQFIGGNGLEGIEVISELSPEKDADEISVYTAPQVAFNMAINTPFEMMDFENKLKVYKVVLDYFELLENNTTIQAKLEWNDDKDVLLLKPHSLLPGVAQLKARVKVHWEEKVNGAWRALEFEGKTEHEEKQVAFTTGERPDHIEEVNVAYNYPLTGQNHFYTKESGSGYVQLLQDQGYLFPTREDDIEWTYQGRFIQNGQPLGTTVPLSYNSALSRASFSIPENLNTSTPYAFEIVKRPKVFDNTVDKNVIESDKELSTLDNNTTVSTEVKELEGGFVYADEKVLYATYFATSKYPTFEEKINELKANHHMYSNIIEGWNLVRLNFVYQGEEFFDDFEINGKGNMEPLVRLEATRDNNWFLNFLHPTIYEYYPVNSAYTISWRDDSEMLAGIPPLQGISISQTKTGSLSKEDWLLGNPLVLDGYLNFRYNISYYAYNDYRELKDKAYNQYLTNYNSAPIGIKRLLQSDVYNYIYSDTYGIKILYYLPGANYPSSTNTSYTEY